MYAHTFLLLLTASSLALGASSSGCGSDHSSQAGKKSTNVTIPSSGGTRSFLVHVPASYNKNTNTGVIFSYHGHGDTASDQEALSQFSNATYNPNWLAIYPQGIDKSWQGANYSDPKVHDTIFTADVLKYLRANYCIDDTKIYAAGKSNGGGFVGTLACDPVGGNFAAFAPVSGAFYTDVNSSSPCSPARASLPILEFHGENDTTIPYIPTMDGHGGPLPSIPSWLKRWSVRDGCSSNAANYTRRPNVYDELVTKTSWNCSGITDIVTGYLIDDLGHDWPSKSPNSDNPNHPTVIEATQVIMNFFQRFTFVNGKTVANPQ